MLVGGLLLDKIFFRNLTMRKKQTHFLPFSFIHLQRAQNKKEQNDDSFVGGDFYNTNDVFFPN